MNAPPHLAFKYGSERLRVCSCRIDNSAAETASFVPNQGARSLPAGGLRSLAGMLVLRLPTQAESVSVYGSTISFERTLRIPDSGEDHRLPPVRLSQLQLVLLAGSLTRQ
jgi:hypothetical protein